MNSDFTVFRLDSIQGNDQTRFGSKAVNLARMRKLGFPVPDGFCISIDDVEKISSESQIVELRHFGKVAVRSSGIDEDLSSYSFAGQYETFLNVDGEEKVANSILQCLRSRESDRIRTYRDEIGLKSKPVAILVQKMVSAQLSGVCFTEVPDRPQEVVIEMVEGLGDKLVSGSVRPSHFRLNRETFEIVEKLDPQFLLQKLGLENLQSLAKKALCLTDEFGHGLDLEWAFDQEGLWFLQARPLTHRATQNRREELIKAEKLRLRSISEKSGSVWSDSSIGDVLQSPSPLTVDGYRETTNEGSGVQMAFRNLGMPYRIHSENPIYDSICGRSFVNVTEYFKRVRGVFPLKALVLSSGTIGLGIDWNAGLFRLLAFPILFPFAALKQLYSIRSKFYPLRGKFHREFSTQILSELEEKAKLERKLNLADLTDLQLWEKYCRYFNRNRNQLNYYHMLTDIISMVTHASLRTGLKLVYGKRAKEVEVSLTTGVVGNFNTETNLALSEVARGNRKLESFLEEYGHRGNPDWEVAAPRWREDQTVLLQMISQLKNPEIRGLEEFETQKKQRLEFESQFKKELDRNLIGRILKKFILNELKYYQIYSPLREKTHHLCFLWVELARQVILEMARRAEAKDLLFYLKRDELRSYFLFPTDRADLIKAAQGRKNDLRLLRSVYIPHILSTSDQFNIDHIGNPPPLKEGTTSLSGEIVFKGHIQGIARVVKSLDEARNLQKGEILVTQFTDPSWTPLFFIAGGLVLEQGSNFSHGALVAREIGLPSLVNVDEATRYIKQGQPIILDADHGKVILS